MNTHWKITASLRHVTYHGAHLHMRLETLTYLWPIVFPKKQKTKQNGFPSYKTVLSVCVRARMCLSGPRPVASQMGVCEEDYYCKPALPTHTVSKTYIHKTHFPHHPTPTRRSVWRGFEKKKKKTLNFYLGYKRQNNIFSYSDSVAEAGLKWSMYVELETIFWRSCKAIEANRWNSPRFVFLGIDTAQHNSVYYMHISERDTGVCESY